MVDPALCSYFCWQDDSIMTRVPDANTSTDLLIFVVELRFRYLHENPSHDYQVLLSRQAVTFLHGQKFLSGADDEKLSLLSYLRRHHSSNLPESVRESIVNGSVEFAWTMVYDPKNWGQKLLPMAVDVVIRGGHDAAIRQVCFEQMTAAWFMSVRIEHEVLRGGIARARWEWMEVVRFVPATRSSIEALEKVTILDKNSCLEVDQCSVCLETLSVGTEVTRMPCSHIFHASCIVRWLESSNLCPLCRFAMPCQLINDV